METQKNTLALIQGSNPTGFIFAQGRNCCMDGGSIFDCPWDTNSPEEEIWMDGFMKESTKTFGTVTFY